MCSGMRSCTANLLRLVAREGKIQPRQRAAGFHRGELLFVQEVGRPVLVAKEEASCSPVAPVACLFSRKARNGATPVPGPTIITGNDGVFRQAEVLLIVAETQVTVSPT